jgi:hypothetical protein
LYYMGVKLRSLAIKRLRVCENRVLRITFLPRREEVTGS